MSSFLAKIIDRFAGKTQHREWRAHPFSLPAPRLSQNVEIETLVKHSPEKTWSTLVDVSTHPRWLSPDSVAHDHPRSRRPEHWTKCLERLQGLMDGQ